MIGRSYSPWDPDKRPAYLIDACIPPIENQLSTDLHNPSTSTWRDVINPVDLSYFHNASQIQRLCCTANIIVALWLTKFWEHEFNCRRCSILSTDAARSFSLAMIGVSLCNNLNGNIPTNSLFLPCCSPNQEINLSQVPFTLCPFPTSCSNIIRQIDTLHKKMSYIAEQLSVLLDSSQSAISLESGPATLRCFKRSRGIPWPVGEPKHIHLYPPTSLDREQTTMAEYLEFTRQTEPFVATPGDSVFEVVLQKLKLGYTFPME